MVLGWGLGFWGEQMGLHDGLGFGVWGFGVLGFGFLGFGLWGAGVPLLGLAALVCGWPGFGFRQPTHTHTHKHNYSLAGALVGWGACPMGCPSMHASGLATGPISRGAPCHACMSLAGAGMQDST